MRLFLYVFFWGLVLGSSIIVAGQDAEGIDPALLQGIYAGPKLGEVDKITIKQLQKGLKKLYAIKVPLLESKDIVTGVPLIIVGREAAFKTAQVKEQELTAVSPGGHVIISNQDRIVIAGSNDWDTRYGVYNFLEKLGVRFFAPRFNQATYPEKPQSFIPAFSLTEKPAFSFRSGLYDVWRQMFYQLADPRHGLDPELFNRKKTGSDLWIDHSAGYLVPKQLYYEKHPEFYAMLKNGSRISFDRFTDHRTPLCLSNSEVTRISAERALGWIKKQPDKPFFMITYGDTGLWCQCSKCRKLDPGLGIYSDRLLSWVNPIARAVGKKYPDVTLLTFAYGGTDDPPDNNIPEKNVWIVGSTGLGNIPFWNHSVSGGYLPKRHLDKVEGWLKIVPDRYALCEYQSNKYKPALIDSLKARLQYYQELGVRGIVFTYGKPKNFSLLWQYLWGRMLWNPNQDAMHVAQEFIYHYYGAAAEYIWQIFELSHKQYLTTLKSEIKIVDRYPIGYYSNEFTRQVLVFFSKALNSLPDTNKLREEIKKEEGLFILDWMRHPVYDDTTNESREIIGRQLDRLLELTVNNEKEKVTLARSIHRLAIAVEPTHPGTLKIVEDWLETKKLIKPSFEKLSNGVRLLPESYMFPGFGPAKYHYNCPEKVATGVYVKGNSKLRSHRMVAEFSLDDFDRRKNAILALEGQASDTMSLKPRIRILLNNKEIYAGAADFVKNNWSSQSYTIPGNVLTEGKNKLEIINVSSPLTVMRWNQRWLLISDTVIRFE